MLWVIYFRLPRYLKLEIDVATPLERTIEKHREKERERKREKREENKREEEEGAKGE